MRAKVAADGFAAMVGRPFAARRRATVGANGDEIPEVAAVLLRADTGEEAPMGSKGGGAAPCQSAMFNVACALACPP